MNTMLKISEAAAIALHTMALLAGDEDHHFSTRQIASSLEVSEHHLAKVLQRLVRAGLARSIRGPSGGFTLAREAGEITLMNIYEAIDGPLETGECLMANPFCGDSKCLMGDLLVSINHQVQDYLQGTRLSDLAETAGVLNARI
jgi:Rrf2 family protein